MKNYKVVLNESCHYIVEADMVELNGDYAVFYVYGKGMVALFHKPILVQLYKDIKEH